MVGGVSLVLTLVAILAYMVGAGGSWDFGDGNLRALVMFWLILTTSATMAASLGYIIRSTAGTITASMALLYVSNAIVIINIDWFRETLYNYLPLQVIQGATVSNLDLMGMDMKLSWSTSIIVWLGYALVFWVLGFVRYQRSDI